VQTLDRDAHRQALVRLRGDFPLFAAKALKIVTKEQGLQPLRLNFAQRFVLDLIEQQKRDTGRVRVIILKARQEGISTLIAARFTWHLWLNAYQTGMVVADELDRAGKIFGIYERYTENAPLGAMPSPKRAQHARELAWVTDCSITVDTARDVNVGRGSTIHRLHLSELASWQATEKMNAHDAFNSVMETVPRLGSEAAIESTAKGFGNLFHFLWEQAVAGENDWLPIFLPWWVHEEYTLSPGEVTEALRAEIATSSDDFEREALDEGILWPQEVSGDGLVHVLTVEQLAWRRARIREKGETLSSCPDFTQENPATADEAFLVTGGAFFDEKAIKRLSALTKTITPERRNLVAGKLQHDPRGRLWVWEWPGEAHYVIGADTASGKMIAARSDDERGGRDFCSADVIKVAQWVQVEGKWRLEPCRAQVAQFHGRMDADIFAQGLYHLGMLYSCRISTGDRDEREPSLIAVERNHESGVSTIRVLRDMGYPHLYRKHQQGAVGDRKPTITYGYWTDESSRRVILDTMATYVREDVSGIASSETVKEMHSFVIADDGKPQAQDGAHDDRILSMAIALEMERWHSHGAPSTHYEPKMASTPTGL